MTQCSFIAH